MNICWLENGNFVGGAELFSSEMLSSIPEEVHVFMLLGEDNEEVKKIFKKKKNLSVSIASFPSLRPVGFSTLKEFWNAVLFLKKYVEENNIDIIYANTVRTALIIRCVSLFLPKSIQTVYFAHDYTFPKRFSHFFLKGYSKILTCSYGVKHFIMEQNIHSSFVEVVPNGVDVSLYEDILPIVRPARKVGCLGRIASWKGQLTLLHAAYLLKESHHELPFRFYIFGNPSPKQEDQEYYEHLQNFTKKNGLSGIVNFLGFVPTKKALEELDIVVHASEESEPFGRVPIEAAASKRILCISNIGTPAQIFENNKTAFFFEPKDARGLADALMEAYLNAPKGDSFIQNAYTLVQEEYALDKIQKKFWNTVIPPLFTK